MKCHSPNQLRGTPQFSRRDQIVVLWLRINACFQKDPEDVTYRACARLAQLNGETTLLHGTQDLTVTLNAFSSQLV